VPVRLTGVVIVDQRGPTAISASTHTFSHRIETQHPVSPAIITWLGVYGAVANLIVFNTSESKMFYISNNKSL
jgi:hypothetical protein